MSSPEAAPAGATLAQEAPRVLELAKQALEAGEVDAVPNEAIQQLLLAGVKLYYAKRDSGVKLAAFPGPEGVTASEVAVACVGMTAVVNLELFELALWAGWSNI